jgi:hypothetical protein
LSRVAEKYVNVSQKPRLAPSGGAAVFRDMLIFEKQWAWAEFDQL